MCDAQVRQIAQDFDIGAHTVDHVDLTSLNDHQSDTQMVDSKNWVESIIGRDCALFCAPRGRFERRHLALARDAGFVGFRTTELLSTRLPIMECGVNVIPTTIQVYPHPTGTYVKNAIKRRSVAGLMRIARERTHRDWMSLTRELAIQTVRDGGVFHLWGHSWEIAALDLWDELEDTVRFLAGLTTHAPCVTNRELCEVDQ